MSRTPSEATQLRTTRSELKQKQVELAQAHAQCRQYRERATKAEQELAEWKARFDILLRRDDAAINASKESAA